MMKKLNRRGAPPPVERPLFGRQAAQAAVGRGRLKYYRADEKNEFLFNLWTNEREKAGFKTTRKAEFQGLCEEYAKWEAQILPRPQRT